MRGRALEARGRGVAHGYLRTGAGVRGSEMLPGRTSRIPLDWRAMALPRGRVYVILSRCKECRFCVDFCPKDVLAISAETNAKGYHYPVVAPGQEDACIHCEFCSLVCPEYAIYTVEVRPAEVAV
jgi:2-oxoglutarate ferredoxin oxidoreductase subunit delta